MILYQRFYPTKLDRAKAEISSESYWSEPELRGKIVAIYVHVRRLTRLVAVKVEAVRARSKNGRHPAIVSDLQSSPHSDRLCVEDSDPWRLRERNPKVGRGDVPATLPGMRVRVETPGPPTWKGANDEKTHLFVYA